MDEKRKSLLQNLAKEITQKLSRNEFVKLIFICTHNSRRSHMAQLWTAAYADEYRIQNIKTYSGGTEATAFNPMAVAAMRRAGWSISEENGDNPTYQAHFRKGQTPLHCFSTKHGDPPNPSKDFVAIMTCAEANEACPIVTGADSRFAISYEDPKAADNTPAEEVIYDTRCEQIRAEMHFLMQAVAQMAKA